MASYPSNRKVRQTRGSKKLFPNSTWSTYKFGCIFPLLKALKFPVNFEMTHEHTSCLLPKAKPHLILKYDLSGKTITAQSICLLYLGEKRTNSYQNHRKNHLLWDIQKSSQKFLWSDDSSRIRYFKGFSWAQKQSLLDCCKFIFWTLLIGPENKARKWRTFWKSMVNVPSWVCPVAQWTLGARQPPIWAVVCCVGWVSLVQNQKHFRFCIFFSDFKRFACR